MLDLSELVTVVKLQVLDTSLVEILLSWPLESVSPGLVSEPVTDKVGITSVDENWNLLEDSWYETVEWLHPITLEEEVAVDIKVAAIVAAHFNAELLLNICLVQVFANPSKSRVAEIAGILALATDIVNVLQHIVSEGI